MAHAAGPLPSTRTSHDTVEEEEEVAARGAALPCGTLVRKKDVVAVGVVVVPLLLVEADNAGAINACVDAADAKAPATKQNLIVLAHVSSFRDGSGGVAGGRH
jgi:hypothetical protein